MFDGAKCQHKFKDTNLNLKKNYFQKQFLRTEVDFIQAMADSNVF